MSEAVSAGYEKTDNCVSAFSIASAGAHYRPQTIRARHRQFQFLQDRWISGSRKAEYQRKTTDLVESQLAMIKRLELTIDDHKYLIKHCQKRGIQFISSPFDLESVDLLAHNFDLPRLKIPSGEITNAPLLLKAAYTCKPIILSTGMSYIGEVEMALGVMDAEFSENMDEEKATNLALKSIRSSIQRDSASGDGIDILIINKKGKSENSYPVQ